MSLGHPLGTRYNRDLVDARRHPRFPLQVDIRIYPRDSPVVRGTTVDISQSGISAMLIVEVTIREVVRLEFSLAEQPVEVLALVRQRSAFRYGFQFIGSEPALELIVRRCRQLEMEASLREARSS